MRHRMGLRLDNREISDRDVRSMRAYKLGPAALEYVERELQAGGPLASQIKLFTGEVWAYLPPDAVEFQQIENFKEGGVFTAEDAWDISQAVTSFVKDFLQASTSNLMLAEDQFFGMDDPPNSENPHLLAYAGITYSYLNAELASLNDSEIEDGINSASSYPQIVLLTRITSGSVLPAREEIDEKVAQELVDNLCHMIVGAYDEEGYVVWSDKRSPIA